MQRVRQKDTSAELALRRALHALGLRYRIQVTVSTKPRRVADVTFGGPRVAVFVDGCFWHGCPEHFRRPQTRQKFWDAKITRNQARDAAVTKALRKVGWRVLRLWEHELAVRHEKRLVARLRRWLV